MSNKINKINTNNKSSQSNKNNKMNISNNNKKNNYNNRYNCSNNQNGQNDSNNDIKTFLLYLSKVPSTMRIYYYFLLAILQGMLMVNFLFLITNFTLMIKMEKHSKWMLY